MKPPPNDDTRNGSEEPDFENRDAQELFIDGPEDTTVRPCRPELLPYLKAQRALIAEWEKTNETEA